ncbi:MAG: heme-binding protein [Pirellulales bacterium]
MVWNVSAAIVSFFALVFTSAGVAAFGETNSNTASRADSVALIREALGSKSTKPSDLRAVMLKVKQAAAKNPLVEQTLASASAPDASASDMQAALREAAEILSFEPVEEAPLPKGFPSLTPVGEIRVSRYPAYRVARTTVSSDEDGAAFWRLFRHIQSRKIAMTSPVEMSYDEGGAKPQRAEMAFLYRSVEQGELGRDGAVEVVDFPPQLVLSIGWRGDTNDDNVSAARQLLDAWLRANAAEYCASGKMRVMGHNSPFVAKQKRYFEVQIPVTATSPPPAQ